MQNIRRPALWAAVLFAGLLVCAQASFPAEEDFSSGILDRAGSIEASKTVTKEKYPDADVVLVDQITWSRYKPDGTYIQWFESWSKVLSEKGKRRLKSLSSFFTIPYNTTKFTKVEVVREDGSAVAVDIAANSQETIQHGQMDANIYNPNDKILKVGIPELAVGDTVHVVMRDEFAKVRTPGTWSDYISMENTDPILRMEVVVVAPKERPLCSMVLKNEVTNTVTYERKAEKDHITYRWLAAKVPQAFPEPDMPPLFTQAQRLLVSTIPDWQWISRWYYNLCEPQMKLTTPDMKKTVEDLTRGLSTREEKIRAIFSWVSSKVRYLGLTLEEESPGYEPHPVSMTFDRRAGVCRDKAALLTAMLRLAGIEAFPALVFKGPKMDKEVPVPYFNHAITAVRERDDSYLLMDSTDENSTVFLPAYLADKSYLVATPRGDTLRTSPFDGPEKNMMRVKTMGSLGQDGGLRANVALFFEGINDNAYRDFFARQTRDESRQYFEKIIKNAVPGARITDFVLSPENLQDTARPLEARLSLESPDVRVEGKDTVMVPLPRLGSSVGLARNLARQMGLKQRKYPVYTEFACGVSEEITIDCGSAVGPLESMPAYPPADNAAILWSRKASVEKNVLTEKSTFKMKLPEYSPAQYADLKGALTLMEAADRMKPVFAEAPSMGRDREWYASFGADSALLDEDVSYDLSDARNWTETRKKKIKVLTYGGRNDLGEIKISYNPVWEEVKIKDARVTAPSGEVKALQSQELVLMDQPWVGTAPRYPAGKTLVASLPGLEVGSLIEYTVVKKVKGYPLFSMSEAFAFPEPVVKKTVRVSAPRSLKLKVLASDQGVGLEKIWPRKSKKIIQTSKNREGSREVLTFSAEKVAPFKKEGHLPPWYTFDPVVLASAGTWKDYAGLMETALEAAAASQPASQALARNLAQSARSLEAKITAIRNYVAKNILPAGPLPRDLPLSAITGADKTLSSGYGDSADRAVLLFSMLGAVGFKPEFVLNSRVSYIPDLQRAMRECPSPAWLQELLVRVEAGGKVYYLNDTDQYAKLGTTASDGRPGLFCKTGEIRAIRAAAPDLSEHDEITHTVTLQDDGAASITMSRRIFGVDYAVFRRAFSEMPPEQRRRLLLEKAAAISQDAVPTGDYVTDYSTYPAREEFSVQIPHYAVRQGNFLYLQVPGLIAHLRGVEDDSRENPVFRDEPSSITRKVNVLLPPGVESLEAVPEEFSLPVCSAGSIKATTLAMPMGSRSPKSVHTVQSSEIGSLVAPPDLYPSLLEADRRLSHPSAGTLLLKMKEAVLP